MVGTLPAVIAPTTWDTGLQGNPVTWFEVLHFVAYFNDDSGGFMTEDHGTSDNVIAYAAALPAKRFRTLVTLLFFVFLIFFRGIVRNGTL
jgi:hypothetical protein